MATKLKNMKLTSVDLVRAGANQEADIGLFKSAGPQAEFDEALVRSARSILEDPDLTEDQRAGMLAKSVDDYRAALEEPEEEESADLDEIEEVEKYNHSHAADGKFSSSPGSGGGASGGLNAKVKALLSGDSGNKYKVGALVDEMKVGDRVKVHNHKKNEDYEFEKLSDRDTIGAFQNVTGKNHMASPDHVKSWVQNDVLNGGVPSFTEKAEKGMDEIEEVEKNYDTIEEVQKFNPFHDSLGRFASSNSFRTYSANPKSKAGAMAIGRSARAGHTGTMNVHTESKGENIGQNYTWLQTGQKPAFLTGGAGAQKTPPPPPVPKPKRTRKPKAQQQTQPQQAQQAQHTMVQGKDISKTFKPDPNSKDSIPQQIAAKQGYLGKPRVVSSPEFDQASRASGFTAFRTIQPGTDVKTGKPTKAKDFANHLLYGDESQRSLNGSGGKAMGSGMYFAASKGNSNGFAVSPVAAGKAYQHSTRCYGFRGRSAVVEATLDPSAKIGDYIKVRDSFNRMSAQNRAKFGDVGGYAMAKGYDALRNTRLSDCDYITVYNMTKVVARDTVGKY